MGGTFNPVHYGHLRVAIELAEAFAFTQVNLMPCAEPVHRIKSTVSASHRMTMLKLAIENEHRLVADSRELDRKGSSYTIDTLTEIKEKEQKPLFFAMGVDAFNQIETWKNWQNLLNVSNIIIISRPGYSVKLSSFFKPYVQNRLDQVKPFGQLILFEATALGIASSQIRQLLLSQKSIEYLLPRTVIDYIHCHKLYLTKL